MSNHEQIKMWKDPMYRMQQGGTLGVNPAGDIEQEIKDAELSGILGAGEVSPEMFSWLSRGNDGKYCTLTWECGICPTHTVCMTC